MVNQLPIQPIFLLLQSSDFDHGNTGASMLGPKDTAFEPTSTSIALGAVSATTIGRTAVSTVDL
jgi:hypothetical protein